MYSFVLVSPQGCWVIASLSCLCENFIFWANALKTGMTFYHGVQALFTMQDRRKPKVVHRFPTCPWQVQKNNFCTAFRGGLSFFVGLNWLPLCSQEVGWWVFRAFSLCTFWLNKVPNEARGLFCLSRIRPSSNITAWIKFLKRDFPTWFSRVLNQPTSSFNTLSGDSPA